MDFWNSHSYIKNPAVRAPGLYLCPAAHSLLLAGPPRWSVAAGVGVGRGSAVSPKIFWRPWQNGWVSITLMRLQEWLPRFPHLCHLSPAPFCWEFAPYPVIAYSVFFYSPSFLFAPLLFPSHLLRNVRAARAFVYTHLGGTHHGEKTDFREKTRAGMLRCQNCPSCPLPENKDLLVWLTSQIFQVKEVKKINQK